MEQNPMKQHLIVKSNIGTIREHKYYLFGKILLFSLKKFKNVNTAQIEEGGEE